MSKDSKYRLDDREFQPELQLPNDSDEIVVCMDTIEEEGRRLLLSSGWTPLNTKDPELEIAWRKVEGSRLVMVRSTLMLQNIDADALFRFMGTPEGFSVIDPDTKNHRNSNVRSFPPPDRMVHPNTIITLDYSRTEISGLNPRQYQTLNIRNSIDRLFCSKSVSSSFVTMDKSRITCYTTYILKTSPIEGGRGTRLDQVSWADVGGGLPSCVVNKYTKEMFFQAIHRRLLACLKDEKGSLSSSTADASSENEIRSQMQC